MGILAFAFLSENMRTKKNSTDDLSVPSSTIELKDDTVIVVLGASGDLAKKKTVRHLPRPASSVYLLLTVSSSLRSLDW